MTGRTLKMHPTLCLEMVEGETREDAEDRMVELCDSVGIWLLSWNANETEVEEWEEND